MEAIAIKKSSTTLPLTVAEPVRDPIAVVLMNLGTPDSPEPAAVRAYLTEFLGDPDVISLPAGLGWATPLLARLIAFFRAKISARNYQAIWTDRGSPLLVISNDQAVALERELGKPFQVLVAMRYGNPSLASIFEQIRGRGIQEVVLLPMYPHWAGPTIGSALSQAYGLLAKMGLRWTVHTLSSWHDFEPYLEAQAGLAHRYLAAHRLSPENTVFLFSAHSLPVSYIAAGDPYQQQMMECISHLTARLNWPADRVQTSYQSRLGPVEWIGPSTEHALRELAAKGVKNAVVCPISFTADCVETHQELGIEYRKIFESELGGRMWLLPALNDDPAFISALKALVLKTVGGLE
jgi:ferrochelatase